MYAYITRRKRNPSRIEEVRQLAQRDYVPKLRQAPGFISSTLIHGDDGVTTGVVLWESKEQADAFMQGEEGTRWQRTLDEYGSVFENRWTGEVITQTSANE
jgi:heme-degrading monooxygenase HmoA